MIEVTVWGLPAPQGSMKAFVVNGRANVVPDNQPRLKKWRKLVNEAVMEVWPYDEATSEPLLIEVTFYRLAPKNKRGDVYDDTGPDGDKLMRAIFDALTATKKQKGITVNDSRFTDHAGRKRFCDHESQERAVIRIEGLNRTLQGKETRLGI